MTKQRYLPAIAAAALLMSSAGAMAVVGEHDEQRTDPAEAYEEQQDRTAERDDPWQEEDDWRDEPADPQVGAADDQERPAARNGEGIEQLEQLAQQHGNLNTFIQAIRDAGMGDALVGTTDYTIFAPTDEAFEQSDRSVEELLQPENREELISLLRAHIVADDVDPQMARNIGRALTIDGGTVDLQADEDRLQVGQATVVDQDIQQGNLRIYPIDQVLSPGEEFAAFEGPEATEGQRDQEMQRDDTQGDVDVDVEAEVDTESDDDWGTQRDTDDDW
ncbi:MAG: fasciclin domain-containing protein [Pseudomonadales bacterium]